MTYDLLQEHAGREPHLPDQDHTAENENKSRKVIVNCANCK